MRKVFATFLIFFALTIKVMASEIVANKSVPHAYLSKSQVRTIFTYKQTRWDDGSRVVVVVLPEYHIASKDFCWGTLGIPTSKYFDTVSSSKDNQAGSFIFLERETDVLNFIQKTPGSIGYVGNRIISNVKTSGITVITIEP